MNRALKTRIYNARIQQTKKTMLKALYDNFPNLEPSKAERLRLAILDAIDSSTKYVRDNIESIPDPKPSSPVEMAIYTQEVLHPFNTEIIEFVNDIQKILNNDFRECTDVSTCQSLQRINEFCELIKKDSNDIRDTLIKLIEDISED